MADNKAFHFKKWVLLFAIFILPIIFCFGFYYYKIRKPITEKDTTIFKKLPYFGPKELAANGTDTIYHVVPPFAFTNQDGKIITDKDYNGKIYVAEFFFVSCQTICPRMAANLFNAQKKLNYIKDFRILSHTVNPEEDSVPVLKDYANTIHADPKIWNLVTGDKKAIYDIARHGYFVTAMEGDGGPDDFIHSEMLILVDKEKRIRGIYDGTSFAEVTRMIDEVKVLDGEYRMRKRT
jgi:protein SCO1/2